ncbi:universal stress protein [Adhaeribacter radiodurans]|uniref:Universal stress protein n=1 Tax=Adhaeribacter radiodurans TaxID=2745197 RepID=A0A7L7LA97_9BACT|nr:universal stress protein [Adhaeribacter radiodurans]QMU29673.1 universal stress protein [Adhaeribacter radiodurans]
MKTFLVPTDFSKNAQNALHYAASLASQMNSKLIIVHVVNIIIIPARSGKLVSLTEKTDIPYYLKLNKIADKLRSKKNIDCEVAVIDQYKHGSFQVGLNQFILSNNVDLVIMGTKGATNFLDKMIGTNTFEFIKVTVCPVLVIPSTTHYSNINHIAYVSDFETDETIFLQQLFRFTDSISAQVSILNINNSSHQNGEANEQTLQNLTKELLNVNLIQVNEADTVTSIHKLVQDNQVNVLAVPIHKKDFFEVFFQSSISKELVYNSTLPLLALPEG